MAEPLTPEECQAIAEACYAHPVGWVPRDANLPLAERLVERGALVRTMLEGEPVYHPSDGFLRAAALQSAMVSGQSMN